MIAHSKPWLTTDDLQAIDKQFVGGHIAAGNKVVQFESELKSYLGVKSVFTTANGSNAIYISLLAFGVGKNDEVILPVYVCKNVFDAVIHTGATPVLCDIGEYWCMEFENVKACVSNKTKAIIAVHTLGIYCDIDSLRCFEIPIIEDCCQCFVNEIDGNQLGKKGDIAVYSFNATKCLTTGEGGAISTQNEQLSEKIKLLLSNKSISNPLTDIQCALGISQLAKYDKALKRRLEIAAIYFEELPANLLEYFALVKNKTMYFRFLLTSDTINFEHFQKYMAENGVAVRKGVDKILGEGNNTENVFDNAKKALKRTISIPIYPSLNNNDVYHIVDCVKKYIK
jgi:perosamine synthetase